MVSKVQKNLREFTRIPIHIAVVIQSGERTIKTDQTRDLSMKGIFLLCNPTLPAGSECKVSLLLGGEKQPIPIDLKGKVARATDSGMAIDFTEIELEGYEYLQNLVRYNSHSEHDQVEREIKDHLGLKRKT
ncbi:MAG: PilZ domain-containing protein [Nitrospinaceae bacterium]